MTDTAPSGAVTLRRARPDDAPAVADLLIRARAASAGIPASVHPDEEVHAWVTHVVVPDLEVWLAVTGTGTGTGNDGDRDGDGVVAVMVLDGDQVGQLYVAPAWTGRGLGTRLIEHAKAHRPDGLQLWTFVTNVRARRFYERHGFAVVEATDGSGNEEKEPDLRLVWPAPRR